MSLLRRTKLNLTAYVKRKVSITYPIGENRLLHDFKFSRQINSGDNATSCSVVPKSSTGPQQKLKDMSAKW